MKEIYHKWVIAIFAALISLFAGFMIGAVMTTNWIAKFAVEKLGLGISLDLNAKQIAIALLQYQHALGY